jgi:hypothetical protein
LLPLLFILVRLTFWIRLLVWPFRLLDVADHLLDGRWLLDIFNPTNHPGSDWSVSSIAYPCMLIRIQKEVASFYYLHLDI